MVVAAAVVVGAGVGAGVIIGAAVESGTVVGAGVLVFGLVKETVSGDSLVFVHAVLT